MRFFCALSAGRERSLKAGDGPVWALAQRAVSPLGQTALLFAPSGVRAREASPNQPRRGCSGTMLPLASYSFELAPIRLRPTGYAEMGLANKFYTP